MTEPVPQQPVQSEPAPLPPANEDPAVIAGMTAQDTYQRVLWSIRHDDSLSELQKAEHLKEVHRKFVEAVQAGANDLHDRRTARLTHLQSQVPVGPGIAPEDSAADRAVLSTAFRVELEAARKLQLDDQRAAMAEAIRFGDDNRIRALLTAADEVGHLRVVDDWAAATGNTAVVGEIRTLLAQVQGIDGNSRPWEYKAFRLPERHPPEVANIAVLHREEEERKLRELRERASMPVWMR